MPRRICRSCLSVWQNPSGLQRPSGSEECPQKRVPGEKSFVRRTDVCRTTDGGLCLRKLGGAQPCWLAAPHTVRCIGGAYAVELEIPVFLRVFRFQEHFHATVLAHRRLVGVVLGTQIVASNQKVNPQRFSVVGRGKSRQRPVGNSSASSAMKCCGGFHVRRECLSVPPALSKALQAVPLGGIFRGFVAVHGQCISIIRSATATAKGLRQPLGDEAPYRLHG